MGGYSTSQGGVVMDVEFEQVEEGVVDFIEGAINVCGRQCMSRIYTLIGADLSRRRSKLLGGARSRCMSRMGCIVAGLVHL